MVGIFLANGFEELEAVCVADILRRGGVGVALIGVDGKTATGSHGIEITCDKTIAQTDFAALEMLILPGGVKGAQTLSNNGAVQEALKGFARDGKKLAAICAAPLALAAAGVLGERFTCYPGVEQNISAGSYTGERVEQQANIITSKGPATATDFAFSLLESLKGADVSNRVKADMLFG